MFIDKFKNPNNLSYIDEDNCYWDDAESFIQGKLLNFCCCGNPIENLKYIMEGLNHINVKYPENVPREEFSNWYINWKFEGKTIFGNERACYFFFYWAYSMELSTHGGSIPGWLTDKGKELLADLQDLYINNIMEEI